MVDWCSPPSIFIGVVQGFHEGQKHPEEYEKDAVDGAELPEEIPQFDLKHPEGVVHGGKEQDAFDQDEVPLFCGEAECFRQRIEDVVWPDHASRTDQEDQIQQVGS